MELSKITGFHADPRRFGNSDKLVNSEVELGLEIELEGLEPYGRYPLDSSFWDVKEDGSLRNYGREFVLAVKGSGGSYTPVRGKDFSDALDAWGEWLKGYCKEYDPPQATKRTSIHVHVDVRGMTTDEVRRLILLYAAFEPTLFKVLNNGRDSEIYCLSFSNNFMSTYRASQLINCKNSPTAFHSALQSAQKYESMNIHSILQRGSVEFRIHHGTSDIDEMYRWVNTLLCLRTAALDPTIEIMDLPLQASNLGLLNFVGSIFKENAYLVADYLDESLLLSGIRQVQDIIQYRQIDDLHKTFDKLSAGKKAGEESLLHKWAEKNSRKVYLD